MYTITFREAVYVLHCFQKKSPGGKKTAKTDVDLIQERLKAARQDHKQRYGKERSKKMEVEVGSGNVFADLGFQDATELDIKVRLAVEIVRLINTQRLSQVRAAALLQINQPKVSALKNYKLEGFSVERLMTFLLALGQDVEIRIRSREGLKNTGRIQVAVH